MPRSPDPPPKPVQWLARAGLAVVAAVAALAAVAGAYLVPYLARAADPGCVAYKGGAVLL